MKANHTLHPSRIAMGRAYARDNMMTYDAATASGAVVFDSAGNQTGRRFAQRYTAFDGKTYDSTGAFLVGELERLDQTLHMPLVSTTWSRDIELREDVSIADEVSSFTQSSFGSAGGLGTGNAIGNGKAWMGKSTDQVTGISVDIGKVPHPLTPWAMELKYTILELESAARLGRPIDQQKFEGMKLKHDMDTDEQVYIGDTSLGFTGLVNSDAQVVNVANVAATGSGATTPWATKTPAEILADVNEVITSAWTQSGYAKMPNRLLVPPTQFGQISTQTVSTAGNTSILKYLMENNILSTSGKGKLEILPAKWTVGAGTGGTIGTANGYDRMVAYTKDKNLVRFPMTMLQRTPVQFVSMYHLTTYYCRLGVVEFVYPETLAYRDGL